jgi:hypothetical protein
VFHGLRDECRRIGMTVARHDMAGATIGVRLGCPVRGVSEQPWERWDFVRRQDPALGIRGQLPRPDLMVLIGVATKVVREWGELLSGVERLALGRLLGPAQADRPEDRPVQRPIDNPGCITLRVEVLDALPRSGPHHLIVC